MPNGVPMHLVLYPRAGKEYVCYWLAGELSVYSGEGWKDQKSRGEPLFRLSTAEGAALAWFLRYWLGDHRSRPGYAMRGQIDAEFDS